MKFSMASQESLQQPIYAAGPSWLLSRAAFALGSTVQTRRTVASWDLQKVEESWWIWTILNLPTPWTKPESSGLEKHRRRNEEPTAESSNGGLQPVRQLIHWLQASIHSTDFLMDSFNPVCGEENRACPNRIYFTENQWRTKNANIRYKAPPFTTMPRRKRCKHRAHGSKPVYLAWQSWPEHEVTTRKGW